MKISRLKKGYSIHCTDKEFNALRLLVQQGMLEMENLNSADEWGEEGLTIESNPKFTALANAMAVDEDRR